MNNDYMILNAIINNTKAPARGLRYEIVEFETYLTIRLFRSNYDEMPDTKRLLFAEWVSEIMRQARAAGVNLYLEVYEN